MLGPFSDTRSLPQLHFNRFGVIPKGHNTGKWRLITYLSFPHGRSVNDGIDLDLCSLSYTTVDTVRSRHSIGPTSQDGYRVSLSTHLGTPPGQTAGNEVGGSDLCRPHATLQSSLSSEDFQRGRRRTELASTQLWHPTYPSLS